MPNSREIIITLSAHTYWARYSDFVDVFTSPSGYGPTPEKAQENLKIDVAYHAKHGSIRDRYPEDGKETA